MNALEKLKVAKFKADKSQVDRDNYAAYIADRKENGGWTQADVVEYRGLSALNFATFSFSSAFISPYPGVVSFALLGIPAASPDLGR